MADEAEITRLRDHYHDLNEKIGTVVAATMLTQEQVKHIGDRLDVGMSSLQAAVQDVKVAVQTHDAKDAATFVTKEAFEPTRMIAYALVGFALVTLASLLGALFWGKFPIG